MAISFCLTYRLLLLLLSNVSDGLRGNLVSEHLWRNFVWDRRATGKVRVVWISVVSVAVVIVHVHWLQLTLCR